MYILGDLIYLPNELFTVIMSDIIYGILNNYLFFTQFVSDIDMIYGLKSRSYFKSFHLRLRMISQILISIIVFNFFGNVYTKHNGQNKSKEINLQEINEKLDHLTNQTTLLSCWAKSSIEDKIFWKESSNFIHNYTLDGGWTFGNYNNYGPMAISTTLNGCGVGKVHFGPYFHECTPPKITQQIVVCQR